MKQTNIWTKREAMFDVLKEVNNLSEISKKIEIINYLKCKIEENNIIINNLLLLGKTCRSSGMFQQNTYIGIINDIWFFFIEVENDSCGTILLDKNCDIIFDIFYNRELIKSDKDMYIRETKALMLYNKLNKKFFPRHKEKIRKI